MSTPASPPPAQRTLYLLVLSLSHAVVDVNTGAVVALLPLLRNEFDLSYAMVGSIILFAQLTSSLTQPFFGLISDRVQRRWLLVVSPFLAGAGVAATGFMPTYALLLAAVVLSALGTAAFHPEGAHAAFQLGGERRVAAMAVYNVGGNLGYALAPAYVGLLIAFSGSLRGTVWAVPLPLALCALVLFLLPAWRRFEARYTPHLGRKREDLPRTNWYGLSVLTLFTMLRQVIQLGILTYLPFYWIDVLGHEAATSRWVLLTYLLAGVAGTLVGAPLADRIGTKQLVVASFAVLILFQLLILQFKGWLLLACLAVAGFLVVATATVTLVMSQDYAPRHLGLASGLNLGLAFGFGGVGTAILGVVADHFGVLAVLWVLAALIPVALAFAAVLPPVPAAPAASRAG